VKSQSTWAITPLYDVGKNTIIFTNDFKLVGKEQKNPVQKLIESAPKGQNWIKVADTTGWKAGDEIVITTTQKSKDSYDQVRISSVDNKN